jgi:3-carboxy-cis,cis-muconate cycloisomerase
VAKCHPRFASRLLVGRGEEPPGASLQVLTELFAALVSTDALVEATGDGRWVGAMLDTEAALARAQEAAGVIPPGAGEAITRACAGYPISAADLGRHGRPHATPVVPLVDGLRRAVGEPFGPWVHWGATSQDVVDTAAMVVTRGTLDLIDTEVAGLVQGCARLASRHRDSPMAGRTLLQQAAPITFGLKAAGWLVAAMDAGDGLTRLRPRLALQLGGPVGSLAAMGDRGLEVMARMAVELDLAEPTLPWFTARGRIGEIASSLAVAAGTAAKIATDVILLSQSEVAEVAESGPGGGSSSMPHKHNPAAAVTAVAGDHRAQGLAATLLGSLVQAHERAAGAWQAEWATLTDLLLTAGGAVAATRRSVEGLRVDTDAMAARAAGLAGTSGLAGALVDRALDAFDSWSTP